MTTCSRHGCDRPATPRPRYLINWQLCDIHQAALDLLNGKPPATPAPAPPAEAPPAPPKQVRMFESACYTLPLFRKPGRRRR
jgi:hypothetical protein